jgi:aspartate-semialdehyde dehydrogenase
MATAGVRVGVVGATGALGSEVLRAIEASQLRVRDVVAVATDRSLGSDVEFEGEVVPVLAELPSLRGLDLVVLCAPAHESLEVAREALRAEVTCVDCSGALENQPDVPLRIAALDDGAGATRVPLVAAAGGPALAWALVLEPLARAVGLVRVRGTGLEAASVGGRAGIESLYREALAIFNQDEAPAPDVFAQPVAFDCLPAVGPVGDDGATGHEARQTNALQRLLGPDVRLGVTSVQIPAFVGHGAILAVETQRPLGPAAAAGHLDGAPGVELWKDGGESLTTRASAGRDAVLVGRLRPDPTVDQGLLLWLTADLLSLTAANAVQLAAAHLHHG